MPISIKLLKENIGEISLILFWAKFFFFFWNDTKCTAAKVEIRTIATKSFYIAREIINKEATYGMGENIYKLYT